jgi:hypothetical protein
MPGKRTYAGRICKPQLSPYGYHTAALCNGSHAKLRRFGIHILVALAFVGPRPDGYEVNHKNGIKTDNRPANLEWMTSGENSRHAARMGLLATGDRQGLRLHPESRLRGDAHHARLHPERLARGSGHGCAKLDESNVAAILRSAASTKDLAAEYGVSTSAIGQIRARTTWKHVTP